MSKCVSGVLREHSLCTVCVPFTFWDHVSYPVGTRSGFVKVRRTLGRVFLSTTHVLSCDVINMLEPSTDHVDGETNPDYDQIAGAHELLVSYPFASATPVSHSTWNYPSAIATIPDVFAVTTVIRCLFYAPNVSTCEYSGPTSGTTLAHDTFAVSCSASSCTISEFYGS